jgi:hypothetical protein
MCDASHSPWATASYDPSPRKLPLQALIGVTSRGEFTQLSWERDQAHPTDCAGHAGTTGAVSDPGHLLGEYARFRPTRRRH